MCLAQPLAKQPIQYDFNTFHIGITKYHYFIGDINQK